MANTKVDPIAEALNQAVGAAPKNKIEHFFGDRPQVLDSIVTARKERKLSYRQIAVILSKDPNVSIHEGTVKLWLDRKGIE